MFNVVIFMLSLCAIILTVFASLSHIKDFKEIEEFKIDKDTYEASIALLEKFIKFETIYMVNVEMGKTISGSIGASSEMTNDQIVDINTKVQTRVLESLSDKIRNYFIDNFGVDWLLDYIKIYTLSMILSYSELSMTSLIYKDK